MSKSIRCPKCYSVVAKQENNQIILRSGYGTRQVYHIFNKDNGTITCWNCKEIINLGDNTNVKLSQRSGSAA